MNKILALLILLSGFAAIASEFSQREVQNELDTYKEESILPLNTLYPKKEISGKLVMGESSTNSLNTKKFHWRPSSPKMNFYSEPNNNDKAQDLMEDDSYTESIVEMEKSGLLKGEVTKLPWSADYWPYYQGSAAARYADKDFPGSSDWKVNFDYIAKNPFHMIFAKSIPEEIDNLSPAEKYDLLIDDKSGALTKNMWDEGKHYYEAYGKVETWMGLCHGWAAASYMMERPKRAVSVMSHDGKNKIKFFPDDIKALQTLLWANTPTPTLHIGGRCNEKQPPVDDYGRPRDPSCFDNNAGSWHKVVVNRVGLHKRSFVLDATYDYQVWNQPMIRYSYSYFNPKTMNAEDLEKSIVKVADFSEDKFKKFRAPDTKAVVGVNMQVTYGIERGPEHSETDGPERDYSRTVLYTYDLELNERGEIIGGEWYRLTHPDFLWTPVKESKAVTRPDYYLLGQPNWDGKKELPESWRGKAIEAARRSQPLAKILDSLLTLSNNNN